MPRDHHFIGSDAVQQGARHGLNSNISVTHPPSTKVGVEMSDNLTYNVNMV